MWPPRRCRPAAARCGSTATTPWSLPARGLQRAARPPVPGARRCRRCRRASASSPRCWPRGCRRIGLARSLRSLFYPDDIAGAFAALERFDLGDKLFDRVDRLSGGERQRVGLARALLSPATLWLIDEPLSALDPTRAAQAVATLVQGARERGATLVATLHQVDMALAHFPRIVGLRDGALAFDLPAAPGHARASACAVRAARTRAAGGAADGRHRPPAPAPPAVMHCR